MRDLTQKNSDLEQQVSDLKIHALALNERIEATLTLQEALAHKVFETEGKVLAIRLYANALQIGLDDATKQTIQTTLKEHALPALSETFKDMPDQLKGFTETMNETILSLDPD